MLPGRRKASEGGNALRGIWFATGGNVVDPMVGSGMQQARAVVEEEAVEVVRNHEDGTRLGGGTSSPKESGSDVGLWEWTPLRETTEG